MSKRDKLVEKVLDGKRVNNVTFDELCECALALGWQKKSRAGSSHIIYWHAECTDLLNLQSGPNGKAKPYQVKQLRNFIIHISAQGKLNL